MRMRRCETPLSACFRTEGEWAAFMHCLAPGCAVRPPEPEMRTRCLWRWLGQSFVDQRSVPMPSPLLVVLRKRVVAAVVADRRH